MAEKVEWIWALLQAEEKVGIMRGSATSNLGSYLCAVVILLSIPGQTTTRDSLTLCLVHLRCLVDLRWTYDFAAMVHNRLWVKMHWPHNRLSQALINDVIDYGFLIIDYASFLPCWIIDYGWYFWIIDYPFFVTDGIIDYVLIFWWALWNFMGCF